MDCVARYFIDISFSGCCYSDAGDNYFTTDLFLSPLLPLSLSPLPLLPLCLPPPKPFHSCRELVLHKLPGGILNQSPATKGESVWLITEWCAQHACRQTHTEEEGEEPLSEELTPLQKTWLWGGRGGSANLNMESESCICHPSYTVSAHYVVISRGMDLKVGRDQSVVMGQCFAVPLWTLGGSVI